MKELTEEDVQFLKDCSKNGHDVARMIGSVRIQRNPSELKHLIKALRNLAKALSIFNDVLKERN